METGIWDWGFGIGNQGVEDWESGRRGMSRPAQSHTPTVASNPESPIPNPYLLFFIISTWFGVDEEPPLGKTPTIAKVNPDA